MVSSMFFSWEIRKSRPKNLLPLAPNAEALTASPKGEATVTPSPTESTSAPV